MWTLTKVFVSLCVSFAVSSYTGNFREYNSSVVMRQACAGVAKPEFFVLKMHSDVFVVVRGSASEWDFATLELMDDRVTRVGVFHDGFYKAAEYVIEKAWDHIAKCTGVVYFVGHSYGGAVSTICATLLNFWYPEKIVRGVTFGSVPSVDENLRRYASDVVATFVLDNDMISTLSPVCVLAYLNKTMTINENTKLADLENAINNLWHGYKAEAGVMPVIKGLEKTTPKFAKRVLAHAVNSSERIRYVAGDTYHLSSKKNLTFNDAWVSAEKEFGVLSTDPMAIHQHFVGNYRTAMNNIIE